MTVEQNVGYGLADIPVTERAVHARAMLEAFQRGALGQAKGR